MTQYLPQNLLALFAPRDPIPFLPPPDKLPHEKKTTGYTGIGQFVCLFEDPKDTPPPMKIETREERQDRKRRERAEQVAYKLEQDIALWDPANNPASTTDPYKTLFVARINYDSSESKLRREFEIYGAIRKIAIAHDNSSGKPRGFAFIEYEHERDMHSAYKHADGKKIDGRRVLVDVERGRIVKGWLPRRLGGGLGGTRRGGPEVNVKHSGREDSRLDGSYLEREKEGRDKGDRDRDKEKRRSRSRDRDRKRRSKSRDRHRERDRGRDRSMSTLEKGEEGLNGITGDIKKRERRRSRSRERGGGRDRDRDREHKRKRSRSKSRERKRRDRGPREDRRDRGDKADRRNQDDQMDDVVIKQEPVDESYDQAEYGYNNNDPQDYANTTFKTDNDDDDGYGYNNDGYSK